MTTAWKRVIRPAAMTGLLTVVLLSWCVFATADDLPIRPSILAGTWFPGDAEALAERVAGYLKKADTGKPSGRVKALVVPHAGHRYSGPVAAFGYALLKNLDVTTVIMVGPSHRARFPGASVNLMDYQTPLGIVRVDRELAAFIMDRSGGLVSSNPQVHAGEHCLEIQLPFLQVVKPGARFVPVIMGHQDLDTCRRLADVLAEAAKKPGVMLLCSTDLSHFHSGEKARAMDGRLIERVKAFNPEALHQGLFEGEYEACGGGPLVTVMMAAKALGASRADILKYAHSGDVTGDHSQVVGYLAAAFTTDRRAWRTVPPPGRAVARLLDVLAGLAAGEAWAGEQKAGVDLGLTPKEQKTLLAIARRVITDNLEKRDPRLPDDIPARLMKPGGAFVTLKRHGQLRGCIGRFAAEEPLAIVVATMAVQAAFYDPRFPPLSKADLDGLTLEISVLTPFQPVEDVSVIEIGRDGLVIEQGYNRGLLLPQVAVEEGWNREEFLDFTCRKAGLPPMAWKEKGARIYRFSAQVFSEEGK